VFRGSKALEIQVPRTNQPVSNSLAKRLVNELDVLFLRFYSKYDAGYDVLGSSVNGGSISARYVVNGQVSPEVPADGTNKFMVAHGCRRDEPSVPNPGKLHVYAIEAWCRLRRKLRRASRDHRTGLQHALREGRAAVRVSNVDRPGARIGRSQGAAVTSAGREQQQRNPPHGHLP
jgi:hypothetical protein